ncbi:MAG: DUF3035 domain-containing protein [Pseudomonadota bacterium]
MGLRPVCLLLFFVAACGSGDDTSLAERLTAGSVQAPDEFRVLPQKPLELPEDLTTLPQPLPGTANRTDLTPQADVVAALGGRPGGAARTAGDAALLSVLGRQGVDPGIRSQLRAEDAEFRADNKGLLLERLTGRDTEFAVYGPQRLDPEAEYRRLLAIGIRVPPLPGN